MNHPTATNKLICDLIVRHASPQSRKVAMVVSLVKKELCDQCRGTTKQQIDHCLQHLEDLGLIEIFGSLDNWRASEIALLTDTTFIPQSR